MGHGKYEKPRVKKTKAAETEQTGKKGTAWKRVLIGVLAVVLVIVIAGVAAVNYVLGKLGNLDDTKNDSLNGTVSTEDYYDVAESVEGQETLETLTDDDMVFETVDPLNGENIVNILLIGQDARPGEDRARSDTMIMVTLNRDKNAIQMTSFMRDTYVQIPGWANNKLNAPFRYEGAELLDETLKVNFGVSIDGNVVVNFDEFPQIIDLLGGVDIEMTETEASALRNQFDVSHAKEGVNHLNGEEALGFCRIRYNSGGDYGRTERQRRLLTALAEQVVGSGVAGVLTLVNDVLPLVSTDLSSTQIINYATVGVTMLMNGAEIQTLRIPADDAHYGAMINGMSVLVPNLAMCREDLEEFIYSGSEG